MSAHITWVKYISPDICHFIYVYNPVDDDMLCILQNRPRNTEDFFIFLFICLFYLCFLLFPLHTEWKSILTDCDSDLNLCDVFCLMLLYKNCFYLSIYLFVCLSKTLLLNRGAYAPLVGNLKCLGGIL